MSCMNGDGVAGGAALTQPACKLFPIEYASDNVAYPGGHFVWASMC